LNGTHWQNSGMGVSRQLGTGVQVCRPSVQSDVSRFCNHPEVSSDNLKFVHHCSLTRALRRGAYSVHPAVEYGANKMPKEGIIRGRVSFGAQEEYRVLLEGGVETAAEPSGALRAYGELPAVGDWVQVRPASEFCLIEEVEARRTAFVRRAAGRVHASQCVAANIDLCFVVSGLDGDFNFRRIERYLVLAWESGARPVVVLNKEDVCADVGGAVNTVRSAAGGADVVAMSAHRSVEPLKSWLWPGATAALLGSSGAGKSTIANALTGRALATYEVREHDSRGRHTTTASMLMQYPVGHG
jgi:ribosome biogenesis GTPase